MNKLRNIIVNMTSNGQMENLTVQEKRPTESIKNISFNYFKNNFYIFIDIIVGREQFFFETGFYPAAVILIVTGSNKGIGYGIVKKLAEKNDWNIIMACRNIQLAEKSKQQIQTLFPNSNIHVQQLDVSDHKSIQSFIPRIKEKYTSIDVLVNNAGVAAKGDAFDAQIFDFTFGTNFYGTIQFTERMLSLIGNKGKIVTLGSTAGKMSFNRIKSQELQNRFKNQNITKEELFGLINEFKTGVIDNNYEEKGFPKWIYGLSKLGINIYTSIFAKTKEVLEREIQVYVCCPGYVSTDMTNHKGTLTIEEGILTPMYLVDLPSEINKELQGQFFQVSALSSTF